MGFFSAKCKCCGLSILAPYAVKDYLTPAQSWLNRVVAIFPDSEARNRFDRGNYDGYGRIICGPITIENLWDGKWTADLYHDECWRKAGSPLAFTGGSKDAPDQGFFIDQAKYLKAKPKGLPAAKPR